MSDSTELRWFHVLVERDGKRYLIAIEATSINEACTLIAPDWGADSIIDCDDVAVVYDENDKTWKVKQ